MAFTRRRGGKPDTGDADMADMARRFGCTVTIITIVGFGVPDWILGFRGVTIMVERKKPGEELNERQEKFVKEWNGGPLILLETPTQLQAMLTARDLWGWLAARDLRVLMGLVPAVDYRRT